MEEENVSRKRDGPETRSVVLAPEKKKQKCEFVRKDHDFIRSYYAASMVKQFIQFDITVDWRYGFDCMTETTRNFLHYHSEQKKKSFGYLFHFAYKSNHADGSENYRDLQGRSGD